MKKYEKIKMTFKMSVMSTNHNVYEGWKLE